MTTQPFIYEPVEPRIASVSLISGLLHRTQLRLIDGCGEDALFLERQFDETLMPSSLEEWELSPSEPIKVLLACFEELDWSLDPEDMED